MTHDSQIHTAETQTNGFQVNFKDALNLAEGVLGNNVLASPASGEMTFIPTSTAGLGLPGVNLEPFRYLLNGVTRIFSGLKNASKNKKQLLSVMILTITWLLLTVLPILGISPGFFTYLNFLTFAQGGLDNGISGIIGGTIGKGVFAYFLFSLLMPGKGIKMFAGVGGGVKNLFGSLKVKNKEILALMLLAFSVALFAYKFMTGDASLQNSMAGIAAFFISVRALASKGGFLRGFASSILNKHFKNLLPADIANINPIIAGWTAGFGFAVFLSAMGIGAMCTFVAILLFITALIVFLVAGKKKEGAV
jgi:hypothetical protein